MTWVETRSRAGVPAATRQGPEHVISTASRRRREMIFLVAASAVCGAIPIVFPADIPWISDEPALLGEAWNIVHQMRIPAHGLVGSVGLPYGPVPLILYSLALLVTHSLVALVVLRAFCFMLALGVAIGWLAQTCETLSPPVGVLAMLSPYYWYFSRVLWDNSFLIPFSALTLAAYIAFCRTPRRWKLWVVTLGLVLMVQTHLMCLPLVAAILTHFVWQHRAWAGQHAKLCLAMVGTGVGACVPYLLFLTQPVKAAAATHAGSTHWSIGPWLFPLMAGRTFSALGLDYFFGVGWQHSPLLWTATGISALGLAAFWAGLVAAGRELVRNLRAPAKRPSEFHLWAVVALTLILQVLLNGFAGKDGHPHYYNATSFCAFTLIWLAYSRLRNLKWRWGLAGAHAAALLVVLSVVIYRVHSTQGNTNIHYGPTLRTQMNVLRQIDHQNPRTEVFNATSHYRSFPQAFAVLQMFYPPHSDESAPVRRLLVRNAESPAGTGRMVVTELLPGTTDEGMTRLR